MQATTITLSSKGQVVIPKKVRDALHWDTGTELILAATESGVLLQKQRTATGSSQSLRGFLQHTGKPLPTNEICKPVDYQEKW